MTRPAGDGEQAADALRARGHDVHDAPLMRIEFAAQAACDLNGVQAILATSANGVRALERTQAAGRTALPIFCVGDATARAARQAGFAQVHSASGDVEDLARLVANTLSPARGRLLHVAGKARAGDLAGRLSQEGFAVAVAQLYEASAIDRLDPATVAALQAERIDAVLLYSPRTARLYAERIVADGLEDKVRRLHHVCLSAAVAEALTPLGIDQDRCHVARRPTQDDLFAQIPVALAD